MSTQNNYEPRPIPGFPDYSITREGRVWSKRRRDARGQLCGGVWLKPSVATNGYLQVGLWKQGKRHGRLVHRLILEVFVGPRPAGMEARHLDGRKTRNRLDNLKWGTKSENAQDSIKHGTPVDNRGERSGNAKLTESIVILIRQLWSIRWMDVTRQELGEMFGITKQHVGCIINRKAWAHIS